MLLVLATRSFSAPVCMPDTLTNYIGLGAGGCTINGELVNNFSFSFTTTLSSPLTSGGITVTPSFTLNAFQLLFSAAGNTPSTGFVVTGTDTAQYEIDYTWDPVVIGAEDDMVTNTPVFPGTATVTSKLCAGQAFGGILCPTAASATNTLTVFSNGNIPPPSRTTFAPVLVVGSINVIDLQANGASSAIRGFQQSVFTPEPGTWLPMFAGLAFLLCGRRPRFQLFA